MLVEKRVFDAGEHPTVLGATLPAVRVGYECYGTLNARRDNAVLICHSFGTSSHAAGRYAASDPEPGFWDAIIGPGKAIDTDRFFVMAADTLCNLFPSDPQVTTTGPASIDPLSGKPYGIRFPVVTLGDFVEVQRRLIDALGIERLHCVIGPSMGSGQAMEWAVRYPERVARVGCVIPLGLAADAYTIQTWSNVMALVREDPAWANGDYYDGPGPQLGLKQSMRVITQVARHYGWADTTFARKGEESAHASLAGRFAIEQTVADVAAQRAAKIDANSLLYLAKALQLWRIGYPLPLDEAVARFRAPTLWLPSTSDLLLAPAYARIAVQRLRAQGNTVVYADISGGDGHFAGLAGIASASAAVRTFIAQ